MAQTNVNTTATDCKPNTTLQSQHDDFVFIPTIRMDQAAELCKRRDTASTLDAPARQQQREQLRRSTHRRVSVCLGYIALAAHVLDMAANDHNEPLDEQMLDTLARLLTRANRGIEHTVCNADAFD